MAPVWVGVGSRRRSERPQVEAPGLPKLAGYSRPGCRRDGERVEPREVLLMLPKGQSYICRLAFDRGEAAQGQ